jgi:hypothetical protein
LKMAHEKSSRSFMFTLDITPPPTISTWVGLVDVGSVQLLVFSDS